LEDKRKVKKQDALDEDVLDRNEFSRRTATLAAALILALRQQERAAGRRLAALLDRDWAAMNAQQRGAALRQAADELAGIPNGVEARLRRRAQEAAIVMDRRARRAARAQQALDVAPTNTNAQDRRAAAFAAPTPEFIAQEYARRGVAFAGAAAIALGVGLRAGEDREDLVNRVQQRATAALGRDGYMLGVAGSVLNRARTNSLLNVYTEAGAGEIMVLSARDTRTCEKCLFMHGTVFPIGPAVEHFDRLSRLRSPAAIAEANPFLREGVDQFGNRVVYVPGPDGTRITLGTVLQSRQGQVDRLSTFDTNPNAVQLLSLGVGLPPYHPICRCITVIA
jgi:hypothetical protein